MDKKGIEPRSFSKNKKISNHFSIELHFSKVCNIC